MKYINSTALLIAILALASCAGSGSTQGAYAPPANPAENVSAILRINLALSEGFRLTAVEGVPVLVGPQR